MNRFQGVVLAAVLMAAGGSARAEGFDDLADKATPVWRGRSVAALFWSLGNPCDKLPDDLARRQCEGVRDGRREQVTASTFIIEAAPDALRVGEFDAKKRVVPVDVLGCIACSQTMDGERHLIGGKGDVKVEGGAVRGPLLASFTVPATSAEAAAKWRDDVVPRLKVSLLFKISAPAQVWNDGNTKGYRVDVVGYRVADPCDGKVLTAQPAAGGLRPDKKFCKGGPVVADDGPKDPKKPPVDDGPKEPEIPAVLGPSDIRTALEPARAAAAKCFEAYGVPGMANMRITFTDEGAVVQVEQKGDFVDTPTGNCIEKAIKAVQFPRSKKKKTSIDYPFILR
jgi:hypothetical protein